MTKILHRLMNAFAALLLTLCVASPAIAEVGCSWDAATHAADIDHGEEHGADAPDPGDTDSDTDRDSHCAFSHGHGALASRGDSPALPARILTFAPPIAATFASSLPPGLDRPPRG